VIRSALASLTGLALSASIYAGEITPTLGQPTPTLGSPLGMSSLAIIGAVGLIAGIRYLRNKRS
jgi:hypothetical protein